MPSSQEADTGLTTRLKFLGKVKTLSALYNFKTKSTLPEAGIKPEARSATIVEIGKLNNVLDNSTLEVVFLP